MSWDYVIVGAGSAGCILATRLSEDRAAKVLVLEAGAADRHANVRIPAAFSKLFKTAADWAYYTENEPRLNGRRLYWPRGKMLGGCSSMNAMIYICGNRRDYDRWQELGCAGWIGQAWSATFGRSTPWLAPSDTQIRSGERSLKRAKKPG